MDDGHDNVRVAIISLAIEDYKKALCKGDKDQIKYFEKWFLSDWAQRLSGGSGEYIIEKVKEETRAIQEYRKTRRRLPKN